MGYVYRAEHTMLRREVAIKVLRPELCGREPYIRRMQAEARALAAVADDHLTRVLDLSLEANGIIWFAMELLQGETLSSACQRGPLGTLRALEIAVQLCDVLEHVHAAGIVHRDIKPENVFLVEREGREFVKLLDFSVAYIPGFEGSAGESATREAVIGTPPYMAPEQVTGEQVDHRADVYAIGALLFELLTGAQVFERTTLIELLSAVTVAKPPRPSELRALASHVSREVDQVVARCLEKDPDSRFADVCALRAALVPIIARMAQAEPGRPKAAARAWFGLRRDHANEKPMARPDRGRLWLGVPSACVGHAS